MPVKDFHYRPLWQFIGLLLVLGSFVGSLIPMPINLSVSHSDKMLHVLTYAGLMFWFTQLYTRPSHWRLAIAFIVMGAIIEGLQYLTGYRKADIADALANTVGVIAGWGMFLSPIGRTLAYLDRLLARVRQLPES